VGRTLSASRFFRGIDTGWQSGRTHLEHLDKRHTERQVGQIAAYKTQAEHDAYRYDGSPVRGSREISSRPMIALFESSHCITNPYACGVIGTLCLESRIFVKRAMSWVIIVAKTWCHVVRNNAVVGGYRQYSIDWCSLRRSIGSFAMQLTVFYRSYKSASSNILGLEYPEGEGGSYRTWPWKGSIC
jgi:hypothetical protein